MQGDGRSFPTLHIPSGMTTRHYNDVDTTFVYDNYNLLKEIDWPNGDGRNQFLSDAAGNRIRMTGSDGAPSWTFVYDTTAGIPAVLAETISTGGIKLYVRTPDGRLIARVTPGYSSPDFYYHFDGLGSTRALTNSGGTVIDKYSYDAWGNVTHDYGTTAQPYLFVGQLGYYTHYQDPMMNPFSSNSDKYVLLQLGVRYYAPEIGRFGQRDEVVSAEDSCYMYAGAMPGLAVDPSGQFYWSRWWIIPIPHQGDPPAPTPEKPEDKAMKALANWFMNKMGKLCTKNGRYGPEIGLGIDIINLFQGLPEKFQNALKVCTQSANEISGDPTNDTGVQSACMDCYNAVSAVSGPGGKANWYGSLIACDKLNNLKPARGK
jgi:RHS repeat-associated protein